MSEPHPAMPACAERSEEAPAHRPSSEPALASLSPERVRLPNGVELHLVVAGQGDPLIFIHGAMGDWLSCEAVWPEFHARYRCLTYSRRFSFPNRNEMPSPSHSALDEAEDLRLLMDLLGWRRAILVGSSYGGFTALALAVSNPERVAAVVAVEPPMMKYAAFSEPGRAAAAAFRRDVIEPANAAFRGGEDALAARIMTGGIRGEAAAELPPAQMARRLRNLLAMKRLALSADEFPLLEPAALAALPMPVLLLSGERTPAIHHEIFVNVSTAMPRAQALKIPGAGHGIGADQPAQFVRTVLEHLDSPTWRRYLEQPQQ